MRQKDTIFWVLDFPEHIIHEMEQSLPRGCRLKKADTVSDINLNESGILNTCVMFLTLGTFKSLKPGEREILQQHHDLQKVFVLDSDEGIQGLDFDQLGSFLDMVRMPLTRDSLAGIKAKADEIQELYTDLHLMAREISLERELLARKNVQLEFLNRILTRSSASLKVVEILKVVREEFAGLVEAKGLAAVFWKKTDVRGVVTAEVYLPKMEPAGLIKSKWIKSLLDMPGRFADVRVRDYQEVVLNCPANRIEDEPVPTRQVVVPLQAGSIFIGAVVIVAEKTLRLGRDQLQIISSASNHLALALRNALKYRNIKNEADFDGLTSVYNRQQFDKRIRIELKRHQRHANPLSLIMLDLDHFKGLNDTYGHIAGDMVLKKIGNLLVETVRESDFPARYGGEEFVALLPETTEDQAWLLAERIRKKISRTVFSYDNNKFNVTASMGVACLTPGPLTPGETLVKQADKALYLAKNSGRNMVCTSADLCLGEAISS
ncbi:GGDEF domain-containing protein [Desulfonatronovibrio hydrogenovorans]|uniref:GGDEF domain-containing protein n=1 Tax=Desulfonatronovibrio hydrogenovorans TaxID=53245 RepID=UPI00068959E1|nr:GGDEF domain-containing protein [Desulfonatronovibrio hydrogenovorans]